MQPIYGIIFATLAVIATTLVYGAGTGPDCSLLINSPQFAILCNVSNTSAPINTIPGLPMTGIPLGLQMLPANGICDADCRCVMGATKGGGKCGQSGGKAYCQCNYNPATPTPNPLQSGCSLFAQAPLRFCALQPNGTNDITSIQRLCNSDCVCSHGYPSDTTKNQCTNNTAVSGDNNSYCFCNNGAAPPAG